LVLHLEHPQKELLVSLWEVGNNEECLNTRFKR